MVQLDLHAEEQRSDWRAAAADLHTKRRFESGGVPCAVNPLSGEPANVFVMVVDIVC